MNTDKIQNLFNELNQELSEPAERKDPAVIIDLQARLLVEVLNFSNEKQDLLRSKIETLELSQKSEDPADYGLEPINFPPTRAQLEAKLRTLAQIKDKSPLLRDYHRTLSCAMVRSDAIAFELERKPGAELLLPLVDKLTITKEGLK